MSIFGTPTFVQSTSSNQFSVDVTTSTNDLIVVAARTYQSNPSSVTDTLDNTYTLGPQVTDGGSNLFQLYYCLSSISSGSNTITVNSGGGGWMCVWDVPVTGGTAAFDISGTIYNSGNPPTSLSITTTGTDEIAFAALDLLQGPGDDSDVSFVTDGWTLNTAGIYNTSNNQGGAGYTVFSSAQSDYSIEMTSEASAATLQIVAAFIPSIFSFIQSAAEGSGSYGAVQSVVSYTSNVTKGNLLVACVGASMGSSSSPSISDTLGNSWTLLTTGNNGDGLLLAIWYTVSSSSGANTVTMTPAYGVTAYVIIGVVAEYSGISIPDQSQTTVNKYATTITSDNVSTIYKPELAIGFGIIDNFDAVSVTAGEYWTQRQAVQQTGVDGFLGAACFEDMMLPSTGSYAATMTATSVNDQLASIVTFYTISSSSSSSFRSLIGFGI